jgi:hypothetical protein
MKITKLKSGYVIRLSDTEFGLLEALVSEGEGGICTDGTMQQQGIPPAQERAYDRRIEQANRFLAVDENRRGQ